MSLLQRPTPGLFFASFLYRDDLENQQELLNLFEGKLGPCLTYYHSYFPMADYYSKEMGKKEALRRFFAISLIAKKRELLVELKEWATEEELKRSHNNSRAVNIDIGLVTLENVTLATGKNYVHRTFLGRGVFSDLTLMYEKGAYKCLPWSYPDYSHSQVLDFFNWSRSFLQGQINSQD